MKESTTESKGRNLHVRISTEGLLLTASLSSQSAYSLLLDGGAVVISPTQDMSTSTSPEPLKKNSIQSDEP